MDSYRWRSLNIRRLISWRVRGRNGGVGLYNIAAESKQKKMFIQLVRQKVIMLVVITVISHHHQMDLSYRWRSLNIRRLISWRVRGSWWRWWVWITPLVLSGSIAFVLALAILAILLTPIAVSSWVTLERGLVEATQGKAAANDGRRVIGSSSSQGGRSKR